MSSRQLLNLVFECTLWVMAATFFHDVAVSSPVREFLTAVSCGILAVQVTALFALLMGVSRN